MKHLTSCLAFLVSCACAWTPCQAVGHPTEAQVRAWLDSAEDLYLYKSTPIVLTTGEPAFLVETEFPQRGRNFSHGVVLVRPRLRQAREIEGIAGSRFITVRPERGGQTFVALDEVASGQGTVEGRKVLYVFDGWRPVALLRSEFRDNLGNCGLTESSDPCHAREVEWTFTDVNGDGKPDLVETVTTKSGPNAKALRTESSVVTQYLYQRGTFVGRSK